MSPRVFKRILSAGPGTGFIERSRLNTLRSGLNYSLFLDVSAWSTVSGRALKYETSRERHYRKLKIYVPDADNSTQNISIEYSVPMRFVFSRTTTSSIGT